MTQVPVGYPKMITEAFDGLPVSQSHSTEDSIELVGFLAPW